MAAFFDDPDDLLRSNDSVRRLAVAIAGRGSDGDDLAQEAWLKALRARVAGPLRDPGAFWATLLRRTARDARRGDARRQRREREVAARAPGGGSDPFDLAVYEERRRALVAAIDALPKGQRDVIVARYWEGLEPTAIADRTGEDPAAVRQRLRRALAALRAHVDRRGEAGTWLAPLCVGWPLVREVAATGAASSSGGIAAGAAATAAAAIAGGVLMKKALLAAAMVVIVVLGYASLEFADPEPFDPGGSEGPSIAAAEIDPRHTDQPVRDVVIAMAAVERPAREVPDVAPVRLVDDRGEGLADVPYWLDERPHDSHPGTAPAVAPRTGTDGAADPLPLMQARGEADTWRDWLWFEIDEHLAVAVSLARLAEFHRDETKLPRPFEVRVPKRRRSRVDVDRVPAGAPWQVSVMMLRDGRTPVSRRAGDISRQPDGVWLLRGLRHDHTMGEPAVFTLLDSVSYQFRCESSVVSFREPVQVQSSNRGARFVALEPQPAFMLEVLEPGGWQRSAIGGHWQFEVDDDARGSDFVNGVAAPNQSDWREQPWDRMVVVLRDGELFSMRTSELPLSDRTVTVVRASGRPAIRTIEVATSVMEWPGARTYWQDDLLFRSTCTPAALHTQQQNDQVAVWLHESNLVVQTNRPDVLVGPLLRIAEDGRVAREIGGRLEALDGAELEPLVLMRLVGRYASSPRDRELTVRHELALPGVVASNDSPWLPVRSWRLQRVEGFGWRIVASSAGDGHQRIPDKIPLWAPFAAESRLLVESPNAGVLALPLRR
ncbi:MAG: sigma-70 family RNA polymerase sigma factor [Planctomycetes bacterium]|nr:sigma-70 family RNA polymerase sigma factor [Planctomycetota bacterium]